LPLLLQAYRAIAEAHPGVRLLVIGGGDVEAARRRVPQGLGDSVVFLGSASDEEKASALRSADLYVAPNTGGESFGIVLIEAMAAGTPVLASDISAFRRVLGDGAYGTWFRNEDVEELAARAVELLGDGARRDELRDAASRVVRRYDWSSVAAQIVQVYETVTGVREGGAR
jgi:phosphatidylinositol alpha-mannosyltransferase